jgi:hypothetical protein
MNPDTETEDFKNFKILCIHPVILCRLVVLDVPLTSTLVHILIHIPLNLIRVHLSVHIQAQGSPHIMLMFNHAHGQHASFLMTSINKYDY